MGQAQRIQVRTESFGQGSQQLVVTFRVERFDESGQQVLLVPVQMKGLSLDGSLSDGDWVRVSGSRRQGTIHADQLENLTTGATIKVRGVPKIAYVFGGIIFLIVIAIFIVVIAGFLGFMDDFNNFPTQLR